ncbi:septal ring lytic transglycosylase RlpA family protein [Massilia sp. TWP1-3-3]|uniref:septal ring lytic transglycosylase RlpA family protein n=1 Tax=Massilia sp. TWP1-3-3 TaxID=2804573 RepID=UPI003CF0CA7C
MNVSRHPPLIIAASLLALLSGCAETPLVGGRGHMPAPPLRAASHPPLRAELPALPPPATRPGGYYMDDGPEDSPPPNLEQVPDAQVRFEPYSRYANRPYVVFGKSYTPLLNEQPFIQRGVGSWYGKKFHGQKTSSGELYDMYKMTAAHPTLPIPSYARITSVASGKQVVVRINDRGPFHASRIVDVSYTAAVKLGLLQNGSHEVRLERLLPDAGTRLATVRRNATEPDEARQGPLQAAAKLNQLIVENKAEIKALKVHPANGSDEAPMAVAVAAPAGGFYVQMGAFSRADKAAEIRARIMGNGWAGAGLDVVSFGALHRVLSGPFGTRAEAQDAARDVAGSLGLRPIVIKR